MNDNKTVYWLSEEDIQTVALNELERNLTAQEINRVTALIAKKINWYEAISNSINECVD